MFFLYNLQGFQLMITPLSENLTMYSSNNILQLKNKYIKHMMKYEH